MGIHFTVVGVTAIASASLLLAGCSSSSTEAGEASESAATSAASESAAPTPTGPCELAPDTKVTDLTFEELQQYQLNNGEAIPTLDEFLKFANEKKVGVLPEIKTFAAAEGEPKPVPSDAQFAEFADLVNQYPDITEVLIGSFDETTLKYFADNEPDWARVWFRGIGGSVGDPFAPPTVAEMNSRAPSADALGVLNVLYFQGTFPQNGQQYDVPAEFAAANIPVYIWYNVATGGDSAEDGAEFAGLPSPGWNSIASKNPKNVKWIATDFTKEYSAWAESAPAEAQPAPQMVAHRGGGEESVSENSMQAFAEAVDNGAAVLETDVQWTKPTDSDPNGVPVLMHDDTINRTAACPS
ncbi:MAG: hypothetical protein H6525_03805 [Actinobacteria bacterium]|nr:hypothetical protein [Actinomycetota bacterium]